MSENHKNCVFKLQRQNYFVLYDAKLAILMTETNEIWLWPKDLYKQGGIQVCQTSQESKSIYILTSTNTVKWYINILVTKNICSEVSLQSRT